MPESAVSVDVSSDLPADLTAALEQVADTARPYADGEVGALRAALSIALGHLRQATDPEYPEAVVMYASEDIEWVDETEPIPNWARRLIEAGEVYLVCPVCGRSGDFEAFSEGVEWSSLRFVEDDGLVAVGDGADFQQEGAWGVSHQSSHCYARLSLPEWVEWL